MWQLLAVLSAWGHSGAAIESVDVLLPSGSEAVLLEASIGLLASDDGETFHLVCHEAITTPDAVLLPRYAHSSDGVLLGWLTDPAQVRDPGASLYRSTDQCDWTAPTGLDDVDVQAAAFDRVDPNVAVVVSADDPGQAYRSSDAGASFQPLGFSLGAGEAYTSVRAGPPDTFWAASAGPEGLRIHQSVNGGRDWLVHDVLFAVEAAPDPTLQVLHASPTDPNVAWFLLDSLAVDVLLRTDDGGVTVQELQRIEGYFSDVDVESDGTTWVATNGLRFTATEPGGDTEIARAPAGLGVGIRGDEVWLTARFELTNQGLLRGDAEQGFEEVFSLYDLTGPRECPAEASSTSVCAEAWAQLAPKLDRGPQDSDPDPVGETGDAGDTDVVAPPSGCGCDTGGRAAGLPLALLCLVGRRRHRVSTII